MKTSQIGVDLIKHFEGFKSKPYLCPAGIPTIGYGSTRRADGTKVKLTDNPISEAEAEDLLQSTLIEYENIVTSKLTRPVKQNQFDALVSHAYNTGGSSKTLFGLINTGTNDMLLRTWWVSHYIMGGGKKLNGLIARREAEAKLYFI